MKRGPRETLPAQHQKPARSPFRPLPNRYSPFSLSLASGHHRNLAGRRPLRTSPELLAGTLARGEPLPQIHFRPFDLDLTVLHSSLTRTGITRSDPSRFILIQRSSLPIQTKRYPPIRAEHVSASGLDEIQIRILDQISIESLKNHIF
jgi:hypothetical protein